VRFFFVADDVCRSMHIRWLQSEEEMTDIIRHTCDQMTHANAFLLGVFPFYSSEFIAKRFEENFIGLSHDIFVNCQAVIMWRIFVGRIFFKFHLLEN